MASDKTVERRPYLVLVPMAILLVAFAGSAMWVTMNRAAVERVDAAAVAEAGVDAAPIGERAAAKAAPLASGDDTGDDVVAVNQLGGAPAASEPAEAAIEETAPVAAESDEEPALADDDEAIVTTENASDAVDPSGGEAQAAAAGDDATTVNGPAAPKAPAAPEAEPPEPAPVFDVVRIEPGGGGLVAGRAAPGADVDILVGDRVVGKAVAAPDGAFVAIIDAGRNADPQLVTARTQGEPGVEARASAPVIVVPQDDGAAPVVLSQDDAAPRLIQPAPRGEGDGVTLDAIRYDGEGRVVFAGRAAAGDAVRLYLDSDLIAATEVGVDASWSTRADAPVPAGVYTLRVDHVDADGAVVTRIETPFQRQAIVAGLSSDDSFIVQQGDNLWRIAETIYGEGARYTVIFGANSAAIRDPDLIYPGQVFALPKSDDAAPSPAATE